MQEAETLRTIAEIAIAVAGFTGVVVVFGHRASGDWKRLEAERLWLLLTQALMAMLLSFLPILAHASGLSDTAVWRLSNAVFFACLASVGFRTAIRARFLARESNPSSGETLFGFGMFAAGTVISVAQLVYVTGILRLEGPFLFLTGLVYLLATAASNFWRLLMGSVSIRNS